MADENSEEIRQQKEKETIEQHKTTLITDVTTALKDSLTKLYPSIMWNELKNTIEIINWEVNQIDKKQHTRIDELQTRTDHTNNCDDLRLTTETNSKNSQNSLLVITCAVTPDLSSSETNNTVSTKLLEASNYEYQFDMSKQFDSYICDTMKATSSGTIKAEIVTDKLWSNIVKPVVEQNEVAQKIGADDSEDDSISITDKLAANC